MNTLDANHRLVVYGSLAPGGSAHHLLAGLCGSWERVNLRGYLVQRRGYPVFIPGEHGGDVSAWMIESRDLPDHWPALDEYEGDGYVREIIEVVVGQRRVAATIYLGA